MRDLLKLGKSRCVAFLENGTQCRNPAKVGLNGNPLCLVHFNRGLRQARGLVSRLREEFSKVR